MRNTDKVDVEVKSTPSTHPMEGITHEHPCFGMIHVSRRYGRTEDLFGCEVAHENVMCIGISSAQVTQDLGKNWYYAKDTIAEVEMSGVQYAEMISNPNTQGVPCTIRYRADKGYIRSKGIDTVTQHAESETEKRVEELKQKARTTVTEIDELLNKKGALKKEDKEKIKSLVSFFSRELVSNIPFYEDQVKKSIGKAKIEAMTDIEQRMAHIVSRTGLEVLRNPEVVNKLLQLEDQNGGE